MKLFTLFLCLISMSTVAGLPPTTLVGNDSGESNLFFKLNVPNAQSTKLADGAIIETGNENILANPSFESNRSTTGYAWSVSGATASLDTTNQIHGKNALSLALSSTLNLNQSAATNAANTVGLQAVASVYIKSSLADVNVCSIINNVEDKCVQYNGTNTWVKIEIPFIFGATQNGIKIKTTSSTSGTVLVDNAFVGLSSPFQNVSGAQLLGSVVITGCASDWSTTSTTMASFGVSTACVYTTSGLAQAPSTMIPAIKFSSLQAGDYRIEYEGSISGNTTSGYGQLQFTDGVNLAKEITTIFDPSAVRTGFGGVSQTISYSSAQSNVTLELKALIQAGGPTVAVTGTTLQPGTIKVWYFPPQSKIYSQASQDYAYTNAGTITIGATTTAPTKGTIVYDRIFASRKGQRLIAKYQYQHSSAGVSGSGDYLYTLPSGLSFDTNIIIPYSGTVLASLNLTALATVGRASITRGGAEQTDCRAIAYNSTQFRLVCGSYFSTQGGAVTGYVINATNFNMSVTSYIFSIDIDAPVSGWQDYGVIVGSFAEVPKVPGQSNVDTFSFSFGTTNAATACSASPCSYLDQIGNMVSQVTRTGTGLYTVSLNKTYTKLKMSLTAGCSAGGTSVSSSLTCTNCNSLSFGTNYQVAAVDSCGTAIVQGSY